MPRPFLALLALLALAAALAAPAHAQAAEPIEGTWFYNEGRVLVEVVGPGRYVGTVVEATKFDRCAHRAGERMWLINGAGTRYTGGHNWFNTRCEIINTRGAATWEMLPTTPPNSKVRFCTTSPIEPNKTSCSDLTRAAPPAPSVAPEATGPRDVELQPAAGGKAFRIQVQYRVRTACKSPCAARAELRTRTGRRLYAAALQGDGKLILGRRAGLELPTARKNRFYITVSKAALLRAPFHTEGGKWRVAETRMRVWIRTPTGRQVMTVRDGRIKVSIARIRSGALPGLSGIL